MDAFLTLSIQFLGLYEDDVVYYRIATCIVDWFHKELKDGTYEDNAMTLSCLSQGVVRQLTEPIERQIAHAFFHPGGSQRESVDELIEAYAIADQEKQQECPTTPRK